MPRRCNWFLITCLVVVGCEGTPHQNPDAAPEVDSRVDDDGPANDSNDGATSTDAPDTLPDAADDTANGPDGSPDAPPVFIAEPTILSCTPCGSDMKLCRWVMTSRWGQTSTVSCVSNQDPESGCGSESCSPCRFDQAHAKCSDDGKCAFDRCWSGWGDCNNDPSDGCESPLDQTNHCGGCGVACQPGQLCGATGCVDTCDFPLATCSGLKCADLMSSIHSCGACGTTAYAPTGSRGDPTCKDAQRGFSCGSGLTQCDAECVDTQSDLANCGGCGQACRGSRISVFSMELARCEKGVCIKACAVDQCGDQCTELFSDPRNCGRCGNSCGSGEICYQGQCRAPIFNELARASEAPSDWAVARDAVYWIEANRIMRLSRSNNTIDVLASNAYGPTSIAADDDYVYWVASLAGSIVRQAKTPGATAEALAQMGDGASALRVDATHLYWLAGQYRASVRRSPKVPSTPLPEGQNLVSTISELLVDETSVYYVTSNGRDEYYIRKAGKDGSGAEATLYSYYNDHPGLLGLDKSAIYVSYPLGSGAQTLLVIPKNGTPPLLRDTGRDTQPLAIAADDTNLYAATGKDIVVLPKCAGSRATRLIETTTRKLILDGGVIYYFDGASLRSVVAPGKASTSSTLPAGTCSR